MASWWPPDASGTMLDRSRARADRPSRRDIDRAIEPAGRSLPEDRCAWTQCRPNPPKQLLHLVFGGELSRLDTTEFKDLDKLDIVGIYPNYATAYAAWKAKAQQTVDNAQMRYFIVHLHRLLDPEATAPGRRADGQISHAVAEAVRPGRTGPRRRSGSPRRTICGWCGGPRAPSSSRRTSTSGSSPDLPIIIAMWHGQHFLMPFIQRPERSRQGADVAPSRRRDQRHRCGAARRRHDPRLRHARHRFRQEGRSLRLQGNAGRAQAGLQRRADRRRAQGRARRRVSASSRSRRFPAGRSIRWRSRPAGASCSTTGTAPPSTCRSAAAAGWPDRRSTFRPTPTRRRSSWRAARSRKRSTRRPPAPTSWPTGVAETVASG